MNSLLIDTHILIWLMSGDFEKLSDQLIAELTQVDRIYVSSISLFEIAWLAHHDKIDLNMPYQQWFEIVKNEVNITIMDVTAEIAFRAVTLPEHHKDPHDRMIIATALLNDFKLASVDGKFKLYTELDGLLLS